MKIRGTITFFFYWLKDAHRATLSPKSYIYLSLNSFPNYVVVATQSLAGLCSEVFEWIKCCIYRMCCCCEEEVTVHGRLWHQSLGVISWVLSVVTWRQKTPYLRPGTIMSLLLSDQHGCHFPIQCRLRWMHTVWLLQTLFACESELFLCREALSGKSARLIPWSITYRWKWQNCGFCLLRKRVNAKNARCK